MLEKDHRTEMRRKNGVHFHETLNIEKPQTWSFDVECLTGLHHCLVIGYTESQWLPVYYCSEEGITNFCGQLAINKHNSSV